MRSTPIVRAFRRRSTVVLLSLAAVVPAPSLAEVPSASASAISAPVAPAPMVRWSEDAARSLVKVIEASADEGLNPADYGATRLRAALERGEINPVVFNAAAMKLANDYRYGHVPRSERVDWYSEPANPMLLASLVASGINEGQVEKTFGKLLPQTEDYKSLKRALAETPTSDVAKRTILLVNLERWRWMPRELGDKHIFVNVPSYRVELVEDGAIVAEHAAIVGKPASPTPQFSTEVKAVRFNPGWAVPPGLKAQKLAMYQRNPAAARRAGYSVKNGPNGPEIFQAPGPGNALGQVRLVMPNPYMIYLHDTPEKKLFGKDARALSQGCVRTDRPVEFAEKLLTDDGTDASVIDAALAKRTTTREFSLEKAVPVHIAYFTAEADAGGNVKMLSDPYGRDAKLARALGGTMALASK